MRDGLKLMIALVGRCGCSGASETASRFGFPILPPSRPHRPEVPESAVWRAISSSSPPLAFFRTRSPLLLACLGSLPALCSLHRQWAWFVHRLNPEKYVRDCIARFGAVVHPAHIDQALGFSSGCGSNRPPPQQQQQGIDTAASALEALTRQVRQSVCQ
jgi:hypothetical protein